MYDFLIVGSGLYGSVFAHQAALHGKKCLVIDKRKQAGGNIACDNIEGINVHLYGPHIFHTNDDDIWNYVTSLTPFFNYYHQVSAIYRGRVFNLPFNMNTFYQMWGVITPEQALQKIKEQSAGIGVPANLEEHAIKLIGTDLFNILIKGYTEKFWGKPCNQLPASILGRLPFRLTYDNNYFNDKFQGIPYGGYNTLTNALLKGIEVKLNTDYFLDRAHFNTLAPTIVFTGAIDKFFDYRFGELEYRSLEFKTQLLEMENFQGAAGMKYTEFEIPYTRIIEHKHFEKLRLPHTVITYEYPIPWTRSLEPYYPINDEANSSKYRQYRDYAKEVCPNVLFGGRLGQYRYFEMSQTVGAALKASKLTLSRISA